MDKIFTLINEAYKLSQNPQTANQAYDNIYPLYKNNELPSDYHLTFGWIIYRHLKANLKEMGSVAARKALAAYFRLEVSRPSVLHSSMLFIAIQIEKTYPEFLFCKFLEMWGFDRFRDDDWIIQKAENGQYPSTVQKAIALYMKEAETTPSFQYPEAFAELTGKAVRRYPADVELKRQMAKILMRKGRREEALRLYTGILGDNCKYYLWLDLAEMTDDVRLRKSALCKAIAMQKKDEFLGTAHLKLARILIDENDFPQALVDLNNYYDTYTRNKWKTGTLYWELKGKIPSGTVAADRGKEWLLRESAMAEEWTYSDFPSTIMTMKETFRNRQGKERCKLVATDGLTAVVSPTLLPKSQAPDQQQLYEVKYQQEEGRIAVKKIVLANIQKVLDGLQEKGAVVSGKLRLKTNAKGSRYGFVSNCYVGSHLLNGFIEGDFVDVIVKSEGERKFAFFICKHVKK